MTQNTRILKHLERGKSITPLEALTRFGCFRLSGRIHELREMGHIIERQMVTRNGKRIAKYTLA